MSSVGKVNGDAAAKAMATQRLSETQPTDRAQVQRGRQQTPADSISRLTRFSSDAPFDFSLEADSDQAKFLKSFKDAVKRDAERGQDGNQTRAGEQTSEQRVIGYAERLSWTGLPVAENVSAGGEAKPLKPDLQAVVDTVTKLIGKAVSADAMPQAGQPAQFRFAMPASPLNLSHIQVTLTASALEIVLERSGTASGDEIAAAANALADRLLTRFSKRSVRIIEKLVEGTDVASAEETSPTDSSNPVSRR